MLLYPVHDRMKMEYAALLEQPLLSLRQLLAPIAVMSDTFEPHPAKLEAEARVKAFAIQHHIWLPDRGDAYNSMFADLHRSATSLDRLILIGKIYALLWYIDDTMGNEFQHELTAEQQAQSQAVITGLLHFLQTGSLKGLPAHYQHLSQVMADILADIHRYADPHWLTLFLEALYTHVAPAVQEQDSRRSNCPLLTIRQYTDSRNDISGMYVTIRMIELGFGFYLDRAALAARGLLDDLTRMEYECAALASFLNDFFSFEKEFIDADSDYNLLPLLLLNYPELTLAQAVEASAEHVKVLWYQFLKHMAAYKDEIGRLHPDLCNTLSPYLDALLDAVMAAWKWQVDNTIRYKRPHSIFAELTLSSSSIVPSTL